MGQPAWQILIGAFRDVSEADSALHRISQTYRLMGSPEAMDAVVLGRKANSEARIYRWGSRPMDEPLRDTDIGLAVGVVDAVFPGSALGAWGWTPRVAVLVNAASAAVEQALTRRELEWLSGTLDGVEAAVVVVAGEEALDRVSRVIGETGRLLDVAVNDEVATWALNVEHGATAT